MQVTNNLEQKSNAELISIINTLAEKVQQQGGFIKVLEAELALAKQRHYGRKSEKNSGEFVQQDLFDEADLPDNKDEIEQVEESIIVPAHERKKPGRKKLPKDLPRVQCIHDLAEYEKKCSCGNELTCIDQEKTEQLDIIPAKVQVIEHIKLKYACKKCEETIKTSPGPKHPIPKSIASPGLLAYVLISKFKDHLPLYRQENIFKRMGVDIARNTLALWVIKSAELLLPLYKLMQQQIREYDIAFADETRVQVLNEPDRDASSQSYMWCFIGGPPDKRSIIYHYDPGRAHTVIEDVLAEFNGYLHCDGFVGYDTYAAAHDVELVGCWMHGRRRFVEITKLTKNKGSAHQALAQIAKLYNIESHIKTKDYTSEQCYEYRQLHAKPILEKFKLWLQKRKTQTLPKSPLGKAISYCLNHWDKLTRYLHDGRLHIDNGLTERAIKPFVIGRKNWLFNNSVAGVQAAQVIYSIIETCSAHKIEPYSYLRYVLKTLPYINQQDQLIQMLPFNIKSDNLVIE